MKEDVCSNVSLSNIKNIFDYFSCFLVKTILPFLVTLAVVGFIWGVIQYFLNPDNEEKRKAGKSFIIWGLIALFVIVSVWGLVGIFANTFNIDMVVPQLSQ